LKEIRISTKNASRKMGFTDFFDTLIV
jgi:hypothetical protein